MLVGFLMSLSREQQRADDWQREAELRERARLNAERYATRQFSETTEAIKERRSRLRHPDGPSRFNCGYSHELST